MLQTKVDKIIEMLGDDTISDRFDEKERLLIISSIVKSFPDWSNERVIERYEVALDFKQLNVDDIILIVADERYKDYRKADLEEIYNRTLERNEDDHKFWETTNQKNRVFKSIENLFQLKEGSIDTLGDSIKRGIESKLQRYLQKTKTDSRTVIENKTQEKQRLESSLKVTGILGEKGLSEIFEDNTKLK